MVSTYTIGSRFNKYRNQDQYPDEYYWWTVAFRFGVHYQAEAGVKINSTRIKGLDFYFEVSTWDLDLSNYLANSNYA